MQDDYHFAGKRVAVITGSGSGIGKATAIEFAKAGYYVMINDLEEEQKLDSTRKEISKIVGDNQNSRIDYVLGDTSEEKISKSLMAQTIEKFGRIDVLINNAEIADKASAKNVNEISNTVTNSSYKQVSPYFTLEEYERSDTNLRGVYLCIREAAKQILRLKEQRKSYSIINITSPYESIPKLESDAYTSSMSGVDPFTSSRASLKALTKTVALQLAQKRIRVNAIVPGIVNSDPLSKSTTKRKLMKVPFNRIGEPNEIGKIALFLASDEASYITGSVIYADGGISLPHSNYFLESQIEQD
ncbi:MAG TPA: SDR family oxidoreductase [Nitrososphaeraceae archaeon]